jgi:mannosyl-oligosaccharide alpha-1,2-mannosidase
MKAPSRSWIDFASGQRSASSNRRATWGYSGISDVTKTPMTLDDSCPGYWWAEQMKYDYLIFSDTPRFDYHDNYLSTEGKVLRGLRRG